MLFYISELFKQTLRIDNAEYELGAMVVLSSGTVYKMSLRLLITVSFRKVEIERRRNIIMI